MLLEDKLMILEQLKKNRYGYNSCQYVTVAQAGSEPDTSKLLNQKLASFLVRLAIALMLFTVFFFMKERNLDIYELTSTNITEHLSKHYFLP